MATARLTRAQWVRMQGLRPIQRHGHIIVCGTGVVDFLLDFDRPVIVIDPAPDAALIERARNPKMPIVPRIAEAEFAASIARHFAFETLAGEAGTAALPAGAVPLAAVDAGGTIEVVRDVAGLALGRRVPALIPLPARAEGENGFACRGNTDTLPIEP